MGSPFLLRRDDFEIPPEEIYLDGAYMSPLPAAARRAVQEAYDLQAFPGRVPYKKFFEYSDPVRTLLAQILGLPEEEIGVTNSTGYGAVQIAQGLRWEEGDRVLLGPDEFPSNVYPWLALRERGVSVEFIGERGNALTPAHLERALDGPGRVRLLSVAAIYYLNGNLHPLSEFAELLHEREALLVTDATQAAGSVAIDWQQSGVDALLTSGYKWLLGPYGTGAIWTRPSLLDSLMNIGGNWWANEKSRDLKSLLSYADIPLHGARLDSGETASFLNLGAWRVGLEYLQSIGVEAIETHQRALHDRLAEKIAGQNVRVVTDTSQPNRSPMFYLECIGDLDGERLQEALGAARIRVSLRSGRIRVSPGAWNQPGDIDAMAETIQRVATGV